LVDVLLREKIVESKSDFGRLLQAGAIEIVGGEKITDNKTIAKAGFVYRVGKHRFIRLN
jgi:tyrosyl-tRNA synthetase